MFDPNVSALWEDLLLLPFFLWCVVVCVNQESGPFPPTRCRMWVNTLGFSLSRGSETILILSCQYASKFKREKLQLFESMAWKIRAVLKSKVGLTQYLMSVRVLAVCVCCCRSHEECRNAEVWSHYRLPESLCWSQVNTEVTHKHLFLIYLNQWVGLIHKMFHASGFILFELKLMIFFFNLLIPNRSAAFCPRHLCSLLFYSRNPFFLFL